MPLPLSGQLSLNDIRTELGISGQAPFSLDTAENGGYVAINQCSWLKPSSANPATVSEWYGYNHSATCKTVWVYGAMGTANYTFTGNVYYRIGNGANVLLGSIFNNTCNFIASITSVPQGAPVYFYCTDSGNGQQIYFAIGEGTGCPANSNDACEASIIVDADYDVAITIYNLTVAPFVGGPQYCN